MKKVLSIVLLVVVSLLGGGYLLATAADASTPADPLYGIDLFAEDVQRALTSDDMAKADLEQSIFEERAGEITKLLEDGADADDVTDAVGELSKQRERTEERLVTLYNEEGGYDEASMTEIRNRFEGVVTEQLQTMEQVKTSYDENAGDEAKKGLEDSVETLKTLVESESDSGQGYQEQKVGEDTTGDGVKDRESNAND